MFRSGLLLSFTLLSALPVFAAETRAAESATSARPYIETSYLIAPRQVAGFQLQSSSYDPEQKYAGAGFRYALKDHQETRVDIYVYPAGRMSHATALDQGMQAFRTDMGNAVKGGTYADLEMQSSQAFNLADTQPAAVPSTSGKGHTATDKVVLAAIAEANAESQQGRVQYMTLNLLPQNWPMYSNGYLFYRQLYYFKVRASAAQQRISREQFNALTDLAARTLVPAIEVVNVGGCAATTITVTADAPPEQTARELALQSTTHQRYNCHADTAKAGIDRKSRQAEVVEISYTADEWKSQ